MTFARVPQPGRGATYTSKKACRKCGGTERYESNHQCVPCARANAKRQREKAKLSAGGQV